MDEARDKKHAEVESKGDEEVEQHKAEESSSSSSSSVSQPFAVGKKVIGSLMPLVEALVVNRKAKEDGTVDATIIIAPFLRKGVWMKAVSCIRNSTKFAKKPIEKYRYALPWFDWLAREVMRCKADNEWIRNVLDDINALNKEGEKSGAQAECDGRRREKKDFELSEDSALSEDETQRVLERRKSTWSSKPRSWSLDSKRDYSEDRKKQADPKKNKARPSRNILGSNTQTKKAEKHSWLRSSSDSARSSDSEVDSDDQEVGDEGEDASGMIKCSFSCKDIRRYVDAKAVIASKVTHRRFVIQALYNLYTHYTNLQAFADSIRAKATNSISKPLPSNLIWLQQHAIYIDCLMFETLKGMWGQWNEPLLGIQKNWKSEYGAG